mgnify:CR=1 FL=1
MVTPRDIALIFLSLEALVAGLAPLILIGALAYGVYRLRKLVRLYWPLAFSYVEKAREMVEQASGSIAAPFIRVYSIIWMIRTLFRNLIPRRPA